MLLTNSEAADAVDEEVTLPMPLFLMMFYHWGKTSGQIYRHTSCVLKNVLHRCTSPPPKLDICCMVTSCFCSLYGVHLTVLRVIVKCPHCGEACLLFVTHRAKIIKNECMQYCDILAQS
jgi:hypothetical protein